MNFRDFPCRTHKVCPKGPVIGEYVGEGEGHREGTEQDIGDGQVRNEDVSGSQHCLRKRNMSSQNRNIPSQNQ